MAMKETEGSLRGYFLIAGVIGVLWGLRELGDLKRLGVDVAALPASWKLAIYVPIVGHMLVGIGFVAAGVKLKAALVTDPSWIKKLLIVSGLLQLIDGALITATFGTDLGRAGLIGAGVTLLITTYLYRSVVRLSAEAKARAGVAPPPPIARVV
jgi:hypothetical protein